jgi:hypothetical protein
MTFSWDFNTATLLGIITQAVLLIVFLVRTDARVKSAREIGIEAKRIAIDAHEKIAMQASAIAVFREEVAREYVSHEALRQMESRLTHSIDGIRERLDKVLDTRLVK